MSLNEICTKHNLMNTAELAEDVTIFQDAMRAGIPSSLPDAPLYDTAINHAPKRKDILTADEKKLALRNALRYFPQHLHASLVEEFKQELEVYGRIYMYRFRPTYAMHARPIDQYPASTRAHHVWWQWRCVSELGAVPAHHAVLERDG
jgi:hypothetical protein